VPMQTAVAALLSRETKYFYRLLGSYFFHFFKSYKTSSFLVVPTRILEFLYETQVGPWMEFCWGLRLIEP
jgi:hypothetical protein